MFKNNKWLNRNVIKKERIRQYNSMNPLKMMTWNIPISWEIQYLWSEKHRLNKLTHCHPD